MAPNVVPATAPTIVQVGVAPNAIPFVAPIVAPHAAHRVARGGACVVARGVP